MGISLRQEVADWEPCIAGETRQAAERALRLSSNQMFPAWAKPLIRGNPEKIRVLDVGAGPVTTFGNVWVGHEIEVTAIDPMAEAYSELLRQYGIIPHTPTIYGMGEHLVEQFGENTFDFVYACEVLDQALDPLECYRQMIAVLKPGCSLVSLHEANEGEHNGYEGVHQWNFSLRESRLMLWNHQGQYDVLENCQDVAHYHLQTEERTIRLTLTKKTR